MQQNQQGFIKSIILVVLSATLSSIAIHGFVNPANLFPAGFLGISKLISDSLSSYLNLSIPYLMIYFILQILLTLLVIRLIGKRFAMLTVIQFSLVSLSSFVVPDFMLVDDRILLVLFGGTLSGISAILALKAHACSGGTDYIAIYFQNTKPDFPIWDYVMYSNWTLLFIAGLLFGWEASLYSMIFQFVATMIINNMDSRNKLKGLYIITDSEDDVAEALFKRFNRGITKLWGEGAFTKSPKTMMFMVVNSFEVEEVVRIVMSIDTKAFINVTKTERVVGNFVRHKIK